MRGTERGRPYRDAEATRLSHPSLYVSRSLPCRVRGSAWPRASLPLPTGPYRMPGPDRTHAWGPTRNCGHRHNCFPASRQARDRAPCLCLSAGTRVPPRGRNRTSAGPAPWATDARWPETSGRRQDACSDPIPRQWPRTDLRPTLSAWSRQASAPPRPYPSTELSPRFPPGHTFAATPRSRDRHWHIAPASAPARRDARCPCASSRCRPIAWLRRSGPLSPPAPCRRYLHYDAR